MNKKPVKIRRTRLFGSVRVGPFRFGLSAPANGRGAVRAFGSVGRGRLLTGASTQIAEIGQQPASPRRASRARIASQPQPALQHQPDQNRIDRLQYAEDVRQFGKEAADQLRDYGKGGSRS
jgi:hypothetical protein